eukprot:2610663-Pyramimonas_sp.AAC.1
MGPQLPGRRPPAPVRAAGDPLRGRDAGRVPQNESSEPPALLHLPMLHAGGPPHLQARPRRDDVRPRGRQRR